MSGKKAIMEQLKKALGDTLNESVAENVSSYLDELVSDRAKAMNSEAQERIEALQEKVGQLSEANNALKEELKEQEEEFKAESEKFADELAEAFATKEKILFEELENYKDETVRVVEQTSAEYRAAIEQMVYEEAKNMRGSLEQVMTETAMEFRAQQEAALAKDVNAYTEDMLTKLDEYLEAELPEALPQGLIEAAAKAEALEGLVEGVIGLFNQNYIKLDESSVEALKEAKDERQQLSEAYNAKVREAVKLTAKVRELEKEVKFNKLSEGMTQDQKKRARKLLSEATAQNIETKFEGVRDIIINESVSAKKRVQAPSKKPTQNNRQQLSEQAKRQVSQIEENIKNPPSNKPKSGFDAEMESWQKSLNRSLR
jgi:hypothetical protein